MSPADARDMTSAVGLLESTCYLRNQLLARQRLGEHGSLARVADAARRYATVGGARSIRLEVQTRRGESPDVAVSAAPLPAAIASRPKTGFGVPMARWLSEPPRGDLRSTTERQAARGILGTALGDHRHGRCHVMRVIHVVPAVSDEASGPSYSVVRLCESLIETGTDAHLAALDWSPGPDRRPYLTTFPLGRVRGGLAVTARCAVAGGAGQHPGDSISFTITACG